jgi:hypothetical protein
LVEHNNHFLATYDDNRQIGLISYSYDNENQSYIILELLEVDDVHYSGIGSNLIANVAKIALEDTKVEGYMTLISKTETVVFYNKIFNLNQPKAQRKFAIYPENARYAVKHYLTQEVEL